MSSDAACRILSNFLLLRAVTSAVSPSATVNSSLIRRRDIVAAVFPGCAAKRVFFFFSLSSLSMEYRRRLENYAEGFWKMGEENDDRFD